MVTKLNADDRVDDVVMVQDANHNEVVEDDAVPLTNVSEILMVVEGMLVDDGLDVQVVDDVCPADDVFLLNDDIIKDGDVF